MICTQASTITNDTTAGMNITQAHTDNGSGVARVNYL